MFCYNALIEWTCHVFESVLSRMQGLPNALWQQNFMSQSLFSKCYSTAGHNHHLSALILQHGNLGWQKWHTFKLLKLGVQSHIWNMFGWMLIKITIAVFQFDITCSTMEASLPSARPHSSRVTTALPSFTTMRLACFNSLRWAKDFPWERGNESARHNIAYTASTQGDMIVSQWWKILTWKRPVGPLHFAWEYDLRDTGQTFECLILDGRLEQEVSLANMAIIP